MFKSMLFRLYAPERASLRGLIRYVVAKAEGGPCYSLTLRRIFRVYHGVDIGLYTHGGCFAIYAMDRYTSIGRYCSFAHNTRTVTHNHPMDFKSSHAFFFNEKFGYCRRDLANYTHLSIGSDVWLGTGALVLPHVRSIGHGAVIGAGAVVSNDVPPYAVVVGNPARVVRFRFPNDVVEDLLRTRWWEKPIEELELDEFTRPFLASAPTGLKKPGVPIEAGSKASRS